MSSPPLESIIGLTVGILGLSLLFLGAVLVHECGHAAAAILFGFRIMGVKVGPIQIKQPNFWPLVWSRKAPLSGFVQVQFRAMPGASAKWQIIGFVLGGPIANFSLVFIALPFFRGETGVANLVSIFTLVSALVGISQLIPFRVKERTSDGAKLFSLLFIKRKRDELLFLFSVRARIDEIQVLVQAGEPQQALSKMEDFVRTAESTPSLPSTAPLTKEISNLRDCPRANSAEAKYSTRDAPTIAS